MVIAIDCRALQDPLGGGVTEYTRHLVDALLVHDTKNEYVLFTTGARAVRGGTSYQASTRCHLVHLHYPNKVLHFAMRFLKGPKLDRLLERRIGKKIDLILFPNINFISVSSTCHYLLVVHDLSFKLFPEFFSLKRRICHVLVQPQKLIHGARTVIAVSEHTKRDIIEQYGVSEEKIKVVYPGIAELTPPSPSYDKRGLRGSYILYLGTLEPRKNIEGLIQAYEIFCKKVPPLPNPSPSRGEGRVRVDLVIAGRPGWLYKSIYRAVAQSSARDRIHLIGPIAEEHKSALLRGAALFVYPSFYEGFGFPPLEAMSLGVPVIVSASSSLPEVVGEAALLVDPTNVADIAEGMQRMVTDKELRNVLIEEGKMNAARFTWQKSAQEFLTLFSR